MNNINPAYQKMMNTGVSSLLTFNTNLNYSLEQQPPLNYDNNYQNFMDEATKKKYGLSKIDDIFKNKNPDLSIFTFGIDLTKFGLNLNSDSEIFSTFGSPFSENPTRDDRQNYKIPPCYMEPNLQINKEVFKKFKDEILFYIFYNMKDETLQMMSVEELYSKGWKYNYRIETWFRDLEEIKPNFYNGKCFNIKNLNVMALNNFEMSENDFCKVEQFKESIQY